MLPSSGESQAGIVAPEAKRRCTRWTESIAQKVKGKKKVESDASRKEIIRSVFGPPVPSQPVSETFVCRSTFFRHPLERSTTTMSPAVAQDARSPRSHVPSGLRPVRIIPQAPFPRALTRHTRRISLSVQAAILEGIHPKMITKGSSGSYFARAKVDGKVQTVA